MSYIKNVKISNLVITSLDGSKTAEVGSGIDSVIQFDYFESIFNPSIEAVLTIVSRDKLTSRLPIIGTEKVTITITHDTGEQDFTFYVQSVNEPLSDSMRSIIVLSLTTEDNIKQELEQYRLTSRYEPTVAIDAHVKNIMNLLGTEKEVEIEKTANSYGFFGNYWRPFRGIYWLAKRSLSKEGQDRSGFLFWETKSKYRFKSIDTIAADAEKLSKEGKIINYQQRDYVSDANDDSDNFVIHSPFVEYNQNILYQLRKAAYGDNTKFFNPHTMPQSFQPEDKTVYSESFGKSDHFGTSDLTQREFGIMNSPSSIDVQPFVSGTMNKDGVVNNEEDDDPHKWMGQSNIKYQSIMSQSQRVTIPMNLTLEAGDPIVLNLILSNEGLDDHGSGVYLIKDLRHTIKFGESGVQCLTNLRCIRDNYGNVGVNPKIVY